MTEDQRMLIDCVLLWFHVENNMKTSQGADIFPALMLAADADSTLYSGVQAYLNTEDGKAAWERLLAEMKS